MIHSAGVSGHSSLLEKPPVHTSLVPCGLLPAEEHYNATMKAVSQIFQTMSGKSLIYLSLLCLSISKRINMPDHMTHAINVPFIGKTKSITAPMKKGIGHSIICFP